MIVTIKNNEGFISGFFEWDVVNEHGVPSDIGFYMYVRDLWVHPSYRNKNHLERLIDLADNDYRNKNVVWVYWERQTRDKKISRLFKRRTALRRLKCVHSKISIGQ